MESLARWSLWLLGATCVPHGSAQPATESRGVLMLRNFHRTADASPASGGGRGSETAGLKSCRPPQGSVGRGQRRDSQDVSRGMERGIMNRFWDQHSFEVKTLCSSIFDSLKVRRCPWDPSVLFHLTLDTLGISSARRIRRLCVAPCNVAATISPPAITAKHTALDVLFPAEQGKSYSTPPWPPRWPQILPGREHLERLASAESCRLLRTRCCWHSSVLARARYRHQTEPRCPFGGKHTGNNEGAQPRVSSTGTAFAGG
eukprot:scaffold7384_cov236-Pinguiococcus_pyrenoidosus.AAC.7